MAKVFLHSAYHINSMGYTTQYSYAMTREHHNWSISEKKHSMLSVDIVDIAVADCSDLLTIQAFSPASEMSLERDVNHSKST